MVQTENEIRIEIPNELAIVDQKFQLLSADNCGSSLFSNSNLELSFCGLI